jgi:MFS family permease
MVAMSLLVLDLTGSGIGVSVVVLAEILPVVVLAPFAGALVDRMSRTAVMICADLWRAALVGLLPFVSGEVWAVYAVAFGLAVGTAFFNPAAHSVLPTLVEDRQLVAANSGIWVAAVLSQIVLAPVAGLLVHTAGVRWAFGLNAISFVASALILTRLRVPRPTSVGAPQWRRDVADGARAITREPALRALAGAQFLAALSAGATSALLVVLAGEHLRVDARGYGLMLGAIGVGAVIGPLLLTRFAPDAGRPSYVFGSFLLRAAVDLVLVVFTALPVALAALVAYGLSISVGAITFTSLLQSGAPAALRGRLLAAFDMVWQLGRLLSLIIGGLTADWLGIAWVYAFASGLLVCAAVVGWHGQRDREPRAG